MRTRWTKVVQNIILKTKFKTNITLESSLRNTVTATSKTCRSSQEKQSGVKKINKIPVVQN